MPFVDIPGGKLHYDRIENDSGTASSPLLLLLPQSTGPIGLRPFIERLAGQHCVITYDQRGTGGSTPAPTNQSMTSQAADVVGLLDALGLQQATLICHSTGCGIGLSVAAQHSGRVDAMVLAAPWTFGDAHLTTMQKLRVAAARTLGKAVGREPVRCRRIPLQRKFLEWGVGRHPLLGLLCLRFAGPWASRPSAPPAPRSLLEGQRSPWTGGRRRAAIAGLGDRLLDLHAAR